VLPITSINPPHVDSETNLLDWWNTNRDKLPQDQVKHLLEAAQALQTSCVPVAFPTETVYGLGADATRSEAVRGIYAAKQRPVDNPLIVHVGSLSQLRALLRTPRENGSPDAAKADHANGIITNEEHQNDDDDDSIPSHYRSMIQNFWPGPLTLLFPLPFPSPFASEVTSSLHTVGIRMPSSPLARLLISLSQRPLAAPSANASTRPSPTTAAHVLHDLDGRIDLILDGGACEVGVESTVVDGLGKPPVILRPGGVGIEEIRKLGGVWGGVTASYQDRQNLNSATAAADVAAVNGVARGSSPSPSDAVVVVNGDGDGVGFIPARPRAPGMKYRHYAPRARVHLFEDTVSLSSSSSEDQARAKAIEYYHNYGNHTHPHTSSPEQEQQPPPPTADLKIGIICTKTWRPGLGYTPSQQQLSESSSSSNNNTTPGASPVQISTFHIPPETEADPSPPDHRHHHHQRQQQNTIYSISLGADVPGVARGLFSALRALDGVGCGVILVEGIGNGHRDRDRGREGEGEGEGEGHLAAAVMNRLRKAAEG
jgi:L-threonylcarbamoyladenylate synthase